MVGRGVPQSGLDGGGDSPTRSGWWVGVPWPGLDGGGGPHPRSEVGGVTHPRLGGTLTRSGWWGVPQV